MIALTTLVAVPGVNAACQAATIGTEAPSPDLASLALPSSPGGIGIPDLDLRLPALAWGGPDAGHLLKPWRLRRIATMIDFFPSLDSGWRLSAGFRSFARRMRSGWSSDRPSRPGALIYSPALTGRLPIRSNIGRFAPAMALGWSANLSELVAFGLEAGTSMDHGGQRQSSAAIAQPRLATAAWSRIDPVAQVALGIKF